MEKIQIKKTLYKNKKYINLLDIPFLVSEDALRVDLIQNKKELVSFFLFPLEKINHLLDISYTKKVEKELGKDWKDKNVFVFISFTFSDNIISNNLDFKFSNNPEKIITDYGYNKLFSITYPIGWNNVIKMYKALNDISKKNNIELGYIIYTKVHRRTSNSDELRLIKADKFINKLERG